MNLSDILTRTAKTVGNHSPALLTGIGIAGLVSTAVLAAKAAYDSALVIDRADIPETTSSFEWYKHCFKLTWPAYIPPVIAGVVSAGALVLSCRVSERRTAAVAAAYTLMERSYDNYRDKVNEKFGSTADRNVRDAVNEDRVNRQPPEDTQIIVTNVSDVVCFDAFSGRYFQSSMEKLKKAQNELNATLINDTYVSLSDFYMLIDLVPTKISDEVGWRSDKLVDLKFTTTMTPDERPCIVVDFNVTPVRNYYKGH